MGRLVGDQAGDGHGLWRVTGFGGGDGEGGGVLAQGQPGRGHSHGQGLRVIGQDLPRCRLHGQPVGRGGRLVSQRAGAGVGQGQRLRQKGRPAYNLVKGEDVGPEPEAGWRGKGLFQGGKLLVIGGVAAEAHLHRWPAVVGDGYQAKLPRPGKLAVAVGDAGVGGVQGVVESGRLQQGEAGEAVAAIAVVQPFFQADHVDVAAEDAQVTDAVLVDEIGQLLALARVATEIITIRVGGAAVPGGAARPDDQRVGVAGGQELLFEPRFLGWSQDGFAGVVGRGLGGALGAVVGDDEAHPADGEGVVDGDVAAPGRERVVGDVFLVGGAGGGPAGGRGIAVVGAVVVIVPHVHQRHLAVQRCLGGRGEHAVKRLAVEVDVVDADVLVVKVAQVEEEEGVFLLDGGEDGVAAAGEGAGGAGQGEGEGGPGRGVGGVEAAAQGALLAVGLDGVVVGGPGGQVIQGQVGHAVVGGVGGGVGGVDGAAEVGLGAGHQAHAAAVEANARFGADGGGRQGAGPEEIGEFLPGRGAQAA